MECQVVVEKNLEVGEQCSIVKTFFVMEGVQNTSIDIAILALFYCVQIFIKWKYQW
jgi:hypothetical protein